MKLYILTDNGVKKYINISASSRPELVKKIGSEFVEIDGTQYHVSHVRAEATNENAPVSAVIGGALGLVGGMPGVLVGGALGALLGYDTDKKERTAIEIFNRSSLSA